MNEQEMAGHEEGIRTARKFLAEEEEDSIEAVLLSVQYEEDHREAVTSTRLEEPASSELFDMLADHVVYLANKHDSHPAGVLQHLIEVVQERDDTPDSR